MIAAHPFAYSLPGGGAFIPGGGAKPPLDKGGASCYAGEDSFPFAERKRFL